MFKYSRTILLLGYIRHKNYIYDAFITKKMHMLQSYVKESKIRSGKWEIFSLQLWMNVGTLTEFIC